MKSSSKPSSAFAPKKKRKEKEKIEKGDVVSPIKVSWVEVSENREVTSRVIPALKLT